MTARQYHYGLGGLSQDKAHALELYRTAAKQGLAEAKEAFNELERELGLGDRCSKVEAKKEEKVKELPRPSSGSLLEQKFVKLEVMHNNGLHKT